MQKSGIERIIERITSEAEDRVRDVERRAREKNAELLRSFEERAAQESAEALAASEKACAALIGRKTGEAEMRARAALLKAKQGLIEQVFDMAKEKLLAMDDAAKTEFLAGLAAAASASGREEIVLSRSDANLGMAVCEKANAALGAQGRNAELSLAPEARDIEGGLYLCDTGAQSGEAGGVETNASLPVLMAESRDALMPEIVRILFG